MIRRGLVLAGELLALAALMGTVLYGMPLYVVIFGGSGW